MKHDKCKLQFNQEEQKNKLLIYETKKHTKQQQHNKFNRT